MTQILQLIRIWNATFSSHLLRGDWNVSSTPHSRLFPFKTVKNFHPFHTREVQTIVPSLKKMGKTLYLIRSFFGFFLWFLFFFLSLALQKSKLNESFVDTSLSNTIIQHTLTLRRISVTAIQIFVKIPLKINQAREKVDSSLSRTFFESMWQNTVMLLNNWGVRGKGTPHSKVRTLKVNKYNAVRIDVLMKCMIDSHKRQVITRPLYNRNYITAGMTYQNIFTLPNAQWF